MKTELLNAWDPAQLRRAGELLKAGELVAIPTETVYGLAADATNPEAVSGIFTAKQRPRAHPLIVHLASADQLPRWARPVPDWVHKLVERFWPGPLTLLLDKHPRVSSIVTGGLSTIGLRVPNQPVVLELLEQFDLAVAAPSANPYQKLSPTTAGQVLATLDGKIAAVLDDGPCAVGTESTILRVHRETAEILRSGPISADDLAPFLPFPVHTPASHGLAVSGNRKVHYRPNAGLFIRSAGELLPLLESPPEGAGFLVYSPGLAHFAADRVIVMPPEHRGYRKVLYASLHELDQQVRQIWVESPPDEPEWLDIRDRLGRAASD